VYDLAMTLPTGATLCLPAAGEKLVGPRLAAILRDVQITHVLITPSALGTIPAGGFPALKVVSVGGETCSATLVRDWAGGGRRLFNLYGPTEATIVTTWHETNI
jgi:non-ribosomal peptide synthetase component F